MKIEYLPLIAVLALYAQWKFASPFLPSPTLQHESALVRHAPLSLFVAAGILMALAIPNASHMSFIVALASSIAMMFLAITLAYRLKA